MVINKLLLKYIHSEVYYNNGLITCFIFRSTSRTNNMAEVQNEIERIFELAKV